MPNYDFGAVQTVFGAKAYPGSWMRRQKAPKKNAKVISLAVE